MIRACCIYSSIISFALLLSACGATDTSDTPIVYAPANDDPVAHSDIPIEPSVSVPIEHGVLVNPRQVLRTLDGDTIEVMIGQNREHVRFKGLNTPETYPVAQRFGLEAKQFTQAHVGTWVDLIFDSACPQPAIEKCRDQYGRLLAYIRLENGSDLGSELLTRGFAKVYKFYGQSFDRVAEYEMLQSEAKTAHLGVWSSISH